MSGWDREAQVRKEEKARKSERKKKREKEKRKRRRVGLYATIRYNTLPHVMLRSAPLRFATLRTWELL